MCHEGYNAVVVLIAIAQSCHLDICEHVEFQVGVLFCHLLQALKVFALSQVVGFATGALQAVECLQEGGFLVALSTIVADETADERKVFGFALIATSAIDEVDAG